MELRRPRVQDEFVAFNSKLRVSDMRFPRVSDSMPPLEIYLVVLFKYLLSSFSEHKFATISYNIYEERKEGRRKEKTRRNSKENKKESKKKERKGQRKKVQEKSKEGIKEMKRKKERRKKGR